MDFVASAISLEGNKHKEVSESRTNTGACGAVTSLKKCPLWHHKEVISNDLAFDFIRPSILYTLSWVVGGGGRGRGVAGTTHL